MMQIPLARGMTAVLDDEDFGRFSQFHWVHRGERGGGVGYAIRHVKEGRKYRTSFLHREIMGPVPAGHEVIFLNGDKLDCRKENLRVVTVKEARQHHLRARSNSRSNFKNIRYNRRAGTYSVDVYRKGSAYRVGTFWTLAQAQDELQKALEGDNPELHRAPDRVERTSIPIPDASSPSAGGPAVRDAAAEGPG